MKNLLLSLLSPSDAKALAPHLKPAQFKQHHVLFEADERIRHVYFPTGAVVSLVITLSTGEIIEAAMVGMDGVVGASAALDGQISLSRGIIQLGGEIVVCDIDALKSAALESPKLLSLLMRHEQTVYAQAQQSAACFATHRVEARLCRWLLMSHDRAENDEFVLTHKFLSEMLGVRRQTVTTIARTLQAGGLIDYHRGVLHVLSREGLEIACCECYSVTATFYKRIMEGGKLRQRSGAEAYVWNK